MPLTTHGKDDKEGDRIFLEEIDEKWIIEIRSKRFPNTRIEQARRAVIYTADRDKYGKAITQKVLEEMEDIVEDYVPASNIGRYGMTEGITQKWGREGTPIIEVLYWNEDVFNGVHCAAEKIKKLLNQEEVWVTDENRVKIYQI